MKLINNIIFTLTLCFSLISTHVIAKSSISKEGVTLSGISSGGYMATQFHLAYSEYVSGAAIIGAGPYYCGQNDISTALAMCVGKVSQELNLKELNQQMETYIDSGLLSKKQSTKEDKVWLFHGKKDSTVNRKAADLLFEQYSNLVEKNNLIYVNDQEFGHHFPTLSYGTNCQLSEPPFIGNCGYDAAGLFLKHFYPSLKSRSNLSNEELSAQIIQFNQTELGGESASGLAKHGFAFIPKDCSTENQCKLHVSFHGCRQFADEIGRAFIENIGINNWAETNGIVVLYPQTKKSMFMPLNPQGCWDWWGYSSASYATKDGEQIKAIHNMIQNIDKLLSTKG